MNDAPDPLALTVVIATLNEAHQVAEAIASVPWAGEVIVADGGSTDDTVAIARGAGATVIERAGATIGAQRNAAIARATHPWILALDADERGTPALARALRATLAAPTCAAYRVRRENTYLGRVMRGGVFGRDWHTCVFRATLRYDEARVHERLVGAGHVGRFDARRGSAAGDDGDPVLRHTPYRDLAHHAAKLARYAEWSAADRHARGERAALTQVLLKPPARFVRDYLAYGGWRDGWQGAVAAMMSGYSVFLRAAMLRAMQGAARPAR